MKLSQLRQAYLKGQIEKRLYWQLIRENYTHILPELQEIIAQNKEVEEVVINKEGVFLKKKSGVLNYFDFTQSISRAEADILIEGDPEKEDILFLQDFLSKRGVCNVLDIGANVGIFSLDLYQKNENAIFYLFEPIPTTYEWLRRNAQLNGVLEERYKSFNQGMSNKKGSFDFFVPASYEAASLVANEDPFYRKKADIYGNYTGNEEIDKVVCQVTTIDDFVSDYGLESVDLIKIDVEGNEKYVIEGARETLKKNKPLLYCELLRKHSKRFGYHPNEVIAYLKEIGYGCYALKDGELKSVSEIGEDTKETNFIFC